VAGDEPPMPAQERLRPHRERHPRATRQHPAEREGAGNWVRAVEPSFRHSQAKGKAGNVLVPLCGTTPACKSGVSGSITITAAMKTAIKSHLLYVNVHTAKNPAGEIRGQISVG
jgi:hypothetical protein